MMNNNSIASSPSDAGLSSAVVEVGQSGEKKISTTCRVITDSSRKRPCLSRCGDDALYSTETMLKDMQENMSYMRTKMEAVEKTNVDMQAKLYATERKNIQVEERMYDMQTEMQIKLDALVAENAELKTKFNNVQSTAMSLLYKSGQPEEWSYSAEDVPISYWLTKHDFVYAERMVALVGDMKTYTNQLREGKLIDSKIVLSPPDGVGTALQLQYDDMLLPHWIEFANALRKYQQSNQYHVINFFEIGRVELPPQVLGLLAPALKSLRIKTLSLRNNRFGGKGVFFMADIAQYNTNLEVMRFHLNTIESAYDMVCLCNSISSNAYLPLNTISLQYTFNGNDPALLQPILNSSRHLRKIILCGNDIGRVGVVVIATFLASNPHLGHLDLDDNELGDSGAVLLANALKTNNNLTLLELEDNNINDVGRQAFLNVLFNGSSLNSCAASNHSCSITGLNPDIYDINKYIYGNKAMKSFTVLSAIDEGFFDLSCLGDLSYKLIPRVLELAQEFDEESSELSKVHFEQKGHKSAAMKYKLDKKTMPITSMFELLRCWAVPSLA